MIRDIEGYEGLYAVTTEGQIWSYISQKFLKPANNLSGYQTVSLVKEGKKKTQKVHRLVAKAFIPNPDNLPEVNHLNSIRNDNRVENLEWVTSKQNINYSMRPSVKRIFTRVRCIETGEIYKSIAAAARETGIHIYCIDRVLLGQQRTAGGYHWERVMEGAHEKND